MAIDGNYDWSEDQDENDNYDNNDEQNENSYYTHHEDEFAAQQLAARYDNQAEYARRRDDLDGIDNYFERAIASREAENEELGDQHDWLEGHEERIRVLRANRDALALERHYVNEQQNGYNSAWNEERGEWGEFPEADYEAEGLNEEELEDLYQRRRSEQERQRRYEAGDDEEVDMDIEYEN